MSSLIEVGLYGKLPSHGDFLRRRVSDAFVRVWDEWLQECITASRSALGDRWLDIYLTSPVWRFAADAGAFGPAPVMGLMAPSVDRVGRYFHLTLVAELPERVNLLAAVAGATGFFENAERLVLETLAADVVDFSGFDERVAALGYELEPVNAQSRVVLEPTAAAVLDGQSQRGWQIPIGSAQRIASAFEELLAHRLSAVYDPLVLWWTDGSSVVAPGCLIVKGRPHPDAFAALLDGAWSERHWQPVSAHVELNEQANDTLVEESPPRFRSAASSDVGRVRSVNQDSYLERSEVGVWLVADGLGGHSDGEVASRMVCDALADFVPDASFEQTIEAAEARIQQVNDHLVRSAMRTLNAVGSGSTVVALLTRGSRGVVLWAGDSRLYRLRAGHLEQLTRDHNLASEEGSSNGDNPNAVTRAVGGEPTLLLDRRRERVLGGDRFLLCSDGLTRTLSDDQIARWLGLDDIRQAVDGLIEATLEAGAPDNVTALIVEAFR
jgi:type VI secretion system protein ImpM